MTSATKYTAVNPSTLRVRRYRERRRKGQYLLTLEMPERITEAAITRGLLKPGDRASAWVALQAAFASMLSDNALSWLVRNGESEVTSTPMRLAFCVASVNGWRRRGYQGEIDQS
jgi:hypothetical protein